MTSTIQPIIFLPHVSQVQRRMKLCFTISAESLYRFSSALRFPSRRHFHYDDDKDESFAWHFSQGEVILKWIRAESKIYR